MDYDGVRLAQRCRELEQQRDEALAQFQAASQRIENQRNSLATLQAEHDRQAARAETAERRVGELERAVDQALQAPTYEAMEATLHRLNVPIVLTSEEGADDE